MVSGVGVQPIDDTRRLLAAIRNPAVDRRRRVAATWALVGNYRPLLIKTIADAVRSFGLPPSDSGIERLHNEAALRIVDRIDRFDGNAHQFGPWCRVVVRNLTISVLRAEASQARRATPDGRPLSELPSPELHPDEHVVQQEHDALQRDRLAVIEESLDRLRRALTDPKDADRYEVFYLRHQEDLPFAAIGDRLHISEGSARNRYREALQKLQRYIEEARTGQ